MCSVLWLDVMGHSGGESHCIVLIHFVLHCSGAELPSPSQISKLVHPGSDNRCHEWSTWFKINLRSISGCYEHSAWCQTKIAVNLWFIPTSCGQDEYYTPSSSLWKVADRLRKILTALNFCYRNPKNCSFSWKIKINNFICLRYKYLKQIIFL